MASCLQLSFCQCCTTGPRTLHNGPTGPFLDEIVLVSGQRGQGNFLELEPGDMKPRGGNGFLKSCSRNRCRYIFQATVTRKHQTGTNSSEAWMQAPKVLKQEIKFNWPYL